MSPSPDLTSTPPPVRVFRLSPLIRITLLSLYVALTIPLPFLADVTQAPVSSSILWVGLAIGFILLYAALTERVIADETGIQVTYPAWVRWFWRRGWSLNWSEIKALKPRSTGQGGLVYYFLSHSSEQAFLLPMRVAGFAELVRRVEAKTGIDTRDVKPLAQPWMYLILLLFTLILLAIDAWTVLVALQA
ncbi:hypothetical protein C7B61_15560 [filamentous cyanobacterium CCP1]|nr:hypothetical protein C7B76_30240 [filamentous cyanobacterium CCP2]PSB61708.1 hypothetical protein C7B61_15560 [filamentous cyanobacterium CCP1]